jgi:outer membrane protein assembly factor BamB
LQRRRCFDTAFFFFEGARLTILALGQFNVTASVGSVTAQAQINTVAGTVLPPRTVRWSSPSSPGYSVQQIAQAIPFTGRPNLYSIETGGNGVLVKAATSDGQALGQNQFGASYGDEALSDNEGGLFLDLFYTNSDGTGLDSIVDLDAQTGTPHWRYDNPIPNGYLTLDAVGPDGIAYAIEETATVGPFPFGYAYSFSLIALDHNTGTPLLN